MITIIKCILSYLILSYKEQNIYIHYLLHVYYIFNIYIYRTQKGVIEKSIKQIC